MDKILQWFGQDRIEANLQKIRRFWTGQERYIISITSPKDFYRQDPDPQEMVRKAVLNLEHQAQLPGTNIPTLCADFGTVSTAKYWGGRAYRDSTGQNICIERAAQNITDAILLNPLSADDPSMDACLSIQLFQQLNKLLETQSLWLRAGDLQGVLNTAGLVMDQEQLLMAMYSEPASVHVFLDKVCNFLISYVHYVRKAAAGKIGGTIWPFIFLPQDLGFCVTEDMMPLVSPDMYAEFGLPYLKRMTDALGPCQIHCCGSWGRHARNLADSGIPIRSVEFFYPFTRIEELRPLAEKGVAFVPYISLDQCQGEFKTVEDYYRHLLKTTDDRHRFWFAFIEDTPQALDFTREYA